MILWICFHSAIIILLTLYKYSKQQYKVFYKWFLIAVLIYFATYRDGLGSDYYNYISRLNTYNSLDSLILGYSEPLFSIIGLVINESFFSPIFLFLFCATITNVGIATFLFNYKEFAIISILIYVFLPTLYGQSFNIMRQYVSIGLFYISLNYVGKSKVKYFLIVTIAFLMHMSSVVLYPLYWLLQINIKRKYVLPILLFLIVILGLGLSFIQGLDVKYAEEASSNKTMEASGMIMLYNLFFLFYLLNKKVYEGFPVICRNVFILFILIIDMSYLNFFYYRLSYYFFPIIAISIPYILFKYTQKHFLSYAFVLFLAVTNYYSLISNIGNPIIIPNDILPILSIFDFYY